jgi:hypothetical protein
MRSAYIVSMVILGVLVPAAANSQTPQALLSQLIEASHAKDEATVRSLWDAGPWSKQSDNAGRSLYHQGVRKGFNYQSQGVQVTADRAVATVDIARRGRVVDRVFLYATKTGAGWRFHEGDESKGHVRHFLAGKAPAKVDIRSWPSDPNLHAAGLALVGHMTGKGAGATLVTDDTLKQTLQRLEGTSEATVIAAHWLKSMSRGVVHVRYRSRSVEGSAPSYENMWVVLEHAREASGETFRLVGRPTYGSPSRSSFFR